MGNCLESTDYSFSLPKTRSIDMGPLKGKNLPVIVIYGGPGTGKATQSKLLSEKYNLVKISCGDILREEVSTGNSRGIVIARRMTKGNLVPASLVLDIIKERLLATCETANGYVIDGFPREKKQAVQFEKEVMPVTLVLYLAMEEGLQRDRCQGRVVTSGRPAETVEVIERRIRHFREKSPAILKYYRDKLKEFNGARPVEAVFENLCFQVEEVLTSFDVNNVNK